MSILPPVLERKILTSLVFTESFDTILEEARESEFLVADVLKWLIKHKYVSPMELDAATGEYKTTYMYDSDNMRAYHYCMTGKGFKFLSTI